MYFSELQQHLARDPLRPVYVVYGNNEFEIDEAVEALRARAAAGGDAALSVVDLPKEQRDLAQVMDALRSVPMFVETVMVILRDAGEFVGRHRAALETYLAAPSPTGVLVMTPAKWDRKTKLAKRVEELRGDVACWLPRSTDEVLAWIQRRARAVHKKRITSSAAALLADLCQNDLSGLSAELKKLELYVGQAEEIAEADVSAAAMSYAAYRPFDLCDKLAAGDLRGAMGTVEGLLAEGVAAVVFVGTLRSYYRRLLEAKLLAETAGVDAAVAKFAGHPKERDGFKRQLMRVSADVLTRAYRSLLEADLAVKTSRYPDQLIVEKLVLALLPRTSSRAAAPA